MQTESHVYCDTDAARETSLTATLRRVRVCRRTRKTMRAAVVVGCISAPLLLLQMPPSGPGNTVAENPLIIHSRPLTAAQTVRSAATPDIRVRSSPESGRTVRITTPPDAAVPRLGDAEFHRLLAVHEVGCIQVAGIPARVLPLHPGALED